MILTKSVTLYVDLYLTAHPDLLLVSYRIVYGTYVTGQRLHAITYFDDTRLWTTAMMLQFSGK